MVQMYYKDDSIGIFESEEKGKECITEFFKKLFPESDFYISTYKNTYIVESRKGSNIPMGRITFKSIEINKVQY